MYLILNIYQTPTYGEQQPTTVPAPQPAVMQADVEQPPPYAQSPAQVCLKNLLKFV